MSDAKFDIILQAWINRTIDRVTALDVDHPVAVDAFTMTVDLLDSTIGPYGEAVDRVSKESEEAARAAEEVAQAEGVVEGHYGRLSATCRAEYYNKRANPDADDELFKRRLDRGLPRSPSEFSSLGVDRTQSSMTRAVEYAAGALGEDHPVVQEAAEALADLREALKKSDAEKAEAVEAMQALYAAREEAKTAYIAARGFVQGALSLVEIDESLPQLMPAISSMYGSRSASYIEDVQEQEEEPVEA